VSEAAERWVTRPLGELVTGVARAVAEGQTELDRASLATRRDVRRAVESGDLETPIDTPWFRFAGVEADLNVSLSMRGRPERDAEGTIRAYRPTLVAAPTDPEFTTRNDYDLAAASRVSLDIVPVPGPE
jgi:HAMP domain-containing protein